MQARTYLETGREPPAHLCSALAVGSNLAVLALLILAALDCLHVHSLQSLQKAHAIASKLLGTSVLCCLCPMPESHSFIYFTCVWLFKVEEYIFPL